MRRRLAWFLLLLLGLAACAPAVGRASRKATKHAVTQLTDPRSRAEFAEFVSDRRIQEAAAGFAASVAAAAVDELTEAERMQRVAAALDHYTASLAETAGRGAADAFAERAPELADALLAEASTARNREQLAAVAGSAATAFVHAFAEGLEGELGSAMRQAIQDDIAPGIAGGLDEHVDGALARGARMVSREAVLGSEEAFAELREQPWTLTGGIQRKAQLGLSAVRWIAVGLGVAVAVLLVLLARTFVRERRAENEAERQEAALLLLASVIKVAERRPWARELRDLLRDELRDEPGTEPLRQMLREHPELRLRIARIDDAPPAASAS